MIGHAEGDGVQARSLWEVCQCCRCGPEPPGLRQPTGTKVGLLPLHRGVSRLSRQPSPGLTVASQSCCTGCSPRSIGRQIQRARLAFALISKGVLVYMRFHSLKTYIYIFFFSAKSTVLGEREGGNQLPPLSGRCLLCLLNQ